jgi:hypothetical protein
VPRRVVETEIFGGREWREVVSSGGVVSVSMLRRRALQNGGGR